MHAPGRLIMMDGMLSIIVPAFNEQDSLEILHRQIVEVAARLGEPIEMIFVDDGSTDGSWNTIRDLAGRDPGVSGIRFRRNFGKAAALTAGLRAAKGDLILMIDADLQDDPAEIPGCWRSFARVSTSSTAGSEGGSILGTRSTPAGSSTRPSAPLRGSSSTIITAD